MRAVVVGHGTMGRLHARVLRRLGVDVLTVDPDPRAEADLESLAQLTDGADFACIATPPAQLAECAADAIGLGLHVLVEKPMATVLADAQKIALTAEISGVKVGVGYTERHNPAVTQLKLSLPSVGRIHHVRAERLGPRVPRADDLCLDLLTHELDVLRYLGFDPEIQYAAVTGEHALVSLSLEDHAAATVETSYLRPEKSRRLTVTGEEAILAMDYQEQSLEIWTADAGRSFLPVTKQEPLAAEWSDFTTAVALDQDPGATAADGLAALRLALEVKELAGVATELEAPLS
jgi:UDP-N-acetylglucosamine 3-dehydrogenase